MSQVGRPTKVSDDLARKIAALMNEGQTEAEAAESAGIDRSSFFSWMRRGKLNDPEFMSFWRIVQNAKAKGRAKATIG